MNLESFRESCVYEFTFDEDKVKSHASGQSEIKIEDLRPDFQSTNTPSNKNDRDSSPYNT
eukprot:CAMPEP_0116874032 /NCGR_PEP_ID=MMETSP0463-20121206/5427_1 /TAXON_ID=181622 /ORGANISM="Strombidinopsis sp, Strain SopsisLIS2011" /LENGTH=59 /DNA_ID=CAMNT_0004517137 /DNA_START=1681 /DNA_END=1857 /DNA_ORIENTATION=-